jgi:hypothetical protein
MSDLLTSSDLEIAKKHDTFHSEVITGLAGGVAGGAKISTATNAVTGQVQKTLPEVLNNIAPYYFGDFPNIGGQAVTLTNSTQCLVWRLADGGDGHSYAWAGAFPKVVSAGSTPTPLGSGGWIDRSDVTLRGDLSGGGSLASPMAVIVVDLPPFNGDLDAAINSVDDNTVFILGNKTYVSHLWNGTNRNNKPGIKIIGSGVPSANASFDKLEDGTGTIIRGAVQNSAKGFECHNLGIDLGEYTRINLRGGVYEDAFVNYNFGENAGISYGNLVILESKCVDGNPATYTHCHLAEIGSGITVTGPIEMIYGGHGYVVKCKDFRANGQRITAWGQRLDSWIVKSDAAAKAENVHMGHVHCGKNGFTTRTGFLEAHSSNSTDGVYFDSLTGSHNEGLLQGAAGSTGFITNVHIPMISNAVSYGSDYNVVVPSWAVDWHIGSHEINQCSGGIKVSAGAANVFVGDGIVKGSTTHGYDLNGDYQHGNLVAEDNAGFGVNRNGGDGLNVDRIYGANNANGLFNSIPSAISSLANSWAAKAGYRFSVDVIGRTVHVRGRLDQSSATAGTIAVINAIYRPTSPCVLMATGIKADGETFPILATVETDGRIEIGAAYTLATGGVVDIFGSYIF